MGQLRLNSVMTIAGESPVARLERGHSGRPGVNPDDYDEVKIKV